MKTQFRVPVGGKFKGSSVSSLFSDVFFLEPVKGESCCFGMDCNYGSFWFDKLSRDEHSKIAKTCSKDLDIKQ